MELVGIQVGKVQTHDYNGKEWVTGYMKKPVSGEVFVGEINIEGDEQHHTKFHGGIHRPVLMYSAEHYDIWRIELAHDLPYGSFAENFTVSGLNEDNVCMGDTYQIGDTVRVQVSQPRQPCNQIYQALGIRGIVKKIQANLRSGWYCRVLQTGKVSTGMPIQLIDRPHPEWTIIRTHEVMNERKNRPQEALELATIEELQPTWRNKLAQAGQ